MDDLIQHIRLELARTEQAAADHRKAERFYNEEHYRGQAAALRDLLWRLLDGQFGGEK